MVLLPVFVSLRRNSVKMALPKVATSPSITRAFFRIEVHMPLFDFPSHAALFLCSGPGPMVVLGTTLAVMTYGFVQIVRGNRKTR